MLGLSACDTLQSSYISFRISALSSSPSPSTHPLPPPLYPSDGTPPLNSHRNSTLHFGSPTKGPYIHMLCHTENHTYQAHARIHAPHTCSSHPAIIKCGVAAAGYSPLHFLPTTPTPNVEDIPTHTSLTPCVAMWTAQHIPCPFPHDATPPSLHVPNSTTKAPTSKDYNSSCSVAHPTHL